jgi:hypothetical protein
MDLSATFFLERAHFDNESFQPSSERILDLKSEIIALVTEGDRDGAAARIRLGRALHAVQDYYSHSNWTEGTLPSLEIDTRLGRQTFSNSPPSGTGSLVCESDRVTLLVPGGATGTTSGFFNLLDACGSPLTMPLGKCAHGLGLPWGACPGINKDDPDHPYFPFARELAVQASRDFVEQILMEPRLIDDPDAAAALVGLDPHVRVRIRGQYFDGRIVGEGSTRDVHSRLYYSVDEGWVLQVGVGSAPSPVDPIAPARITDAQLLLTGYEGPGTYPGLGVVGAHKGSQSNVLYLLNSGPADQRPVITIRPDGSGYFEGSGMGGGGMIASIGIRFVVPLPLPEIPETRATSPSATDRFPEPAIRSVRIVRHSGRAGHEGLFDHDSASQGPTMLLADLRSDVSGAAFELLDVRELPIHAIDLARGDPRANENEFVGLLPDSAPEPFFLRATGAFLDGTRFQETYPGALFVPEPVILTQGLAVIAALACTKLVRGAGS